MTMKRNFAGCYDYTINGRTFRLTNVANDAGIKRPLWHVAEVVGGIPQAPFDAAETLREAKGHAEVAAQQNPGKPLIDILD